MSKDTIYRADAINAICMECHDGMCDKYPCGEIKALEQLTSAHPELDEWCYDCKEYDKEKHSCPRWNRVIRNTLKDAQPKIVCCKDCKHFLPPHGCGHDDGMITADENGFCSYAERRSE